MVQVYFDEMSKKSAEWYNYFRWVFSVCLFKNSFFSFIFISSENFSKSDLSSRFSEMCPTYKSTFVDVDWINRDCNQLIADFENVLTDAIHNTSVPVGEALISFIGEQSIIIPGIVKNFFEISDNFCGQ